MYQSEEVISCSLDALKRIQATAANSSDEIEIEFIKELNEQERKFTETLKRSNDRIEGLLIVKTPEIILRDYPGLSKVVSTESTLNSLAKDFEKALKKAQESGWLQLVEQMKETAVRLRQLSQEETSHHEATCLHFHAQGNVESTTCNCDVWGGDRLNERGQWVCDRCEEKCPCPEDNWPRVPDTRKRGHKARRFQVARTDEPNEEAETRDPGVVEPCIVDLFAIEKSVIDKSPDRKIVRDHCPLKEASNVKDKARQWVCSVKENGRTDSSKWEPKEQMVQHGQVVPRSNVEDFNRQGPSHRGTTGNDPMPRNEYSVHQQSFREDEVEFCKLDEDIEEKNICTCGCENIEADRGEQVCSCGCAEIRNLKHNDAIKGDDCEYAELCDSCACELSSGRSIGSTSGIEEKIATRNARSPNELGKIEAQGADKDIDEQATKLEDEIDSVKAKNKNLKELFETYYCEEDIQQILALHCSQPPPIRATHSGLMAAVQVLQSKCRSKDGMIAVLANELRGSESIDRIAKNLTAPSIRYPYLDFDQCGLYAYLKSPTLPRSTAGEQAAAKKFANPKAREEIPLSKIRRTPEPIDFRVIRVISNCLLVSWNMPKDIRGICGYEVRINRNIVAARVRCPTRTNAVLGPLDLSGQSIDLPGLMILTLYAVHPTGDHSELSSLKVQICSSL